MSAVKKDVILSETASNRACSIPPPWRRLHIRAPSFPEPNQSKGFDLERKKEGAEAKPSRISAAAARSEFLLTTKDLGSAVG